jgi:hypothetical protein
METLNKNLFVDIPNTEEGRQAIKTIRKYINRDLVKTIRLRGRGSRVKVAKKLGRNPRAFDQCLPLKHSERMTLYLDYNKQNPSEYNVEVLNDEIRNLKSEMKKLQRWRDFVWQKVSTEEIIEHINDNVDGISQWKKRTLKANIMDIVEEDLV